MLICFLSCVFFSFPSCARDKYLHKAHIRLLARSLTFTFVHLFTHSPRHVEPTVECAPRRTKKKYILHIFQWFLRVCVYFLNINMLMIFPFIFSFSYFLCVCVVYIHLAYNCIHIFFVVLLRKIVSPFSRFAWCRGVVYIKLVIWINMYRYLQGFSSVIPPRFLHLFVLIVSP